MQLKEKIAAYKRKLEEERKEVYMNRLEAMEIDLTLLATTEESGGEEEGERLQGGTSG